MESKLKDLRHETLCKVCSSCQVLNSVQKLEAKGRGAGNPAKAIAAYGATRKIEFGSSADTVAALTCLPSFGHLQEHPDKLGIDAVGRR